MSVMPLWAKEGGLMLLMPALAKERGLMLLMPAMGPWAGRGGRVNVVNVHSVRDGE